MSDEKFLWYLKEHTNEPWAWSIAFTPDECDQIVDIGTALDTIKGQVNDDNVVDSNLRKSKVSWIPANANTAWIFNRCTDMINTINEKFFNFELLYIESLQFTTYEEPGDFYSKHIDMGYKSGGTRKLSFSIQLSDPSTYEGSELVLHVGKSPSKGLQQQGAATIFPSYSLHEVTPITSGKRYSLVGWVVGPNFK